MNMTIKEYIRRKALGIAGLAQSDTDPQARGERLTFVNDIDEIRKNKLREYNVWYTGDADELLNFYTRASTNEYNTDPMYNRNKKSYFWSVSATESDIKRSHSGQPRNIVDTLVSIVGIPDIGVGGGPDSVLGPADGNLRRILDANDFGRLLMQTARPMRLVEGWGAWKINWDLSVADEPILLYYRADAVDFVHRYGRLAAIIYKDYYQDEKGKTYILFETRRQERRAVKDDATGISRIVPCLIIEKELFRQNGQSPVLTRMELKDLPQLKDTQERLILTNYKGFMGCPSITYEDPTGDCPGRSIFTGKTDLFDDLDQCHSQAANTVRRSTVHEYFDTQYLEKDDRTGMPMMPKDFDRKYIMFRGRKGGDGQTSTPSPVTVTQPKLDFMQFSTEEQNILVHTIAGIMSPATLGIDIAKKDNAEAQREKEKVTIFTRNVVMNEERKELKTLCNDLLCANEIMHDPEGKLTQKDYDVYVKYDEFADVSFEAKLETVLAGWQAGAMSDEAMAEYLYGDTLSMEKRERELRFLQHQRDLQEGSLGQERMASDPNAQGAFGELGADGGGYNDMMADPETLDEMADPEE